MNQSSFRCRCAALAWAALAWAALALAALAAPAQAQSQRIAVPSYFSPGPLWTEMADAAPTVGIAIINPSSGPGDHMDPAYQGQVRAMQRRGVRVLCYVHTSYAKRPSEQVQREIERAFAWYAVDGIFLDEVSSGKADLPYYLRCRAFIKSTNPKAITVLNPGTQVDEGYLAAGDIICNFESGYEAYQKYAAPGWLTRYPAARFWHIVLDVPTAAQMRAVARLSKQRHAGWLFVTSYSDANKGNPYDKLPDVPYWAGELLAAKKP